MPRPTNRLRSTCFLTGLAVSLTSMGCISSDDELLRAFEDADELEPEPEPDPKPEPDPEPDPDPIRADKLEGLHIKQLAQFSPFNVTYEMFPYPSANHPFTGPEIDHVRGWPVHALQWKDYASGGAFAFDIAGAWTEVNAIPGLPYEVEAADASHLNDLEAGGVVFSADPNGTWMEANFSDPSVGLAYAALVMHFWKSPVYVSALHSYPPYGTTRSHAIALQRLEFTIPSAPDLLTACGLPANATAATALNTIPNCNHGAVLLADEVSLWNELLLSVPSNPTHASYDPDVNLAPADLITAWWNGNIQGQIVFDPPADATDEDFAGLAVLAEALRDQLLVADDGGYLMLVDEYVAELEPNEG
jgi:hypothetical protein